MGNTFPQRETQNCEFKETVSDTFLNSVSAFANHEGGRIFFGVADSGKVVGINHPKNAMLKIESKINDAIKPRPNFTMHLSANSVIVVEIYEGDDKPYFYKSQAYKRADTSTRVLDTLELKRMILSSENRNFEDLPSRN